MSRCWLLFEVHHMYWGRWFLLLKNVFWWSSFKFTTLLNSTNSFSLKFIKEYTLLLISVGYCAYSLYRFEPNPNWTRTRPMALPELNSNPNKTRKLSSGQVWWVSTRFFFVGWAWAVLQRAQPVGVAPLSFSRNTLFFFFFFIFLARGETGS